MSAAEVKAFDACRAYHALAREIRAAIDAVLESGQLILGPQVEAFEAEFARYVGAAQGVGVGCGTAALSLALEALSIGPGDEVITVANTAVPTVSAIRAVGATPRFVDVRPDTLLMDPDAVQAAIGPRTRALVPVHLYGLAAEMAPLADLARRHGLALVEDCAQAHGTRYGARHVGTFGQVGCFSFYPTKNLGALGDGGLCVTDDPALAGRLRMLRNHGWGADRVAACEGINSRLDEIQAAVLRVKLRHLDRALARRRDVARQYTAALSGLDCRLPLHTAGAAQHSFHLYVLRVACRAALLEALRAARVGFGLHNPQAIHLMPAYKFLGYRRAQLPVTELAVQQVLSLPMYPELRPDEVQRVIAATYAGLGQRWGDALGCSEAMASLEVGEHDAAC